jgi:redox-sensing transcriptional repressor
MSSIQLKSEKISELTVNRLSIYLRCLNELAAQGVDTVSSQSLAERFNLNSAQIRKDLAYFGEFGVRGVGYFIEDLRRHIRSILGLDMPHKLGVIGAGNLGMALANYGGFSSSNFHIVALFDNAPSKHGLTPKGIPIYPIEKLTEVVRSENIDIVALAVPPSDAQAAVDSVVAAGVRAVLNFAPVHIAGPEGVKVKTVDLTISLESLSYALARPAQYSTDSAHDTSLDDVAEEHETA